MKKIFYIFMLFVSGIASAQQYIIGKVTTDIDTHVPGVTVFNLRTEEMVLTDRNGQFIIKANTTDELRFVKQNFDRVSVKVKAEDFTKPMSVSIQLLPQMIEEVEIAFKPTGNLKKDVRSLDRPRVEALNNALANNMKMSPSVAYPSNKMPSTLSMGPNFSAGQVPLFSIGGEGGLLGALINTIGRKARPAKTTPDYLERQAFYKKVKESVNLQYFYDHGIDEYEFEMLVVYTDNKYNLAKNYRTAFNKTTIENYLKNELKSFISTKLSPSQKPS